MLFTVAGSNLFSESGDHIHFWRAAVREKSFDEIAALMADKNSPSWPPAPSSQYVHQLADANRGSASDAITLVESLHFKVREEFESGGGAGKPAIYAAVGAVLEKAGGYSNLLLADSLRRLTLLRIAERVLGGSQSMAEIRKQLSYVAIPDVEVRTLLEQLAPEDTLLKDRKSEIERIAPSQTVYSAIESVGIKDSVVGQARTFSELFEHPSVGAVVVRMAGTKLVYSVSLPGLISFIEKGGTKNELNPGDIRAFKVRMSGEDKLFVYPPLGVRYLSVSHVLGMYEIVENPQTRDAFVRTVLY